MRWGGFLIIGVVTIFISMQYMMESENHLKGLKPRKKSKQSGLNNFGDGL